MRLVERGRQKSAIITVEFGNNNDHPEEPDQRGKGTVGWRVRQNREQAMGGVKGRGVKGERKIRDREPEGSSWDRSGNKRRMENAGENK